MVRDVLTSQKCRDRGIVNPLFMDRLLEEHARARRDNMHWIWALLMLELWFLNSDRKVA
jgi:hypothetical protein